jgi:hypothetical protein
MKKNNFMEEFGLFEEQFENHQRSKSKSKSNKGSVSIKKSDKDQQAAINQQYSSYMKDFQAVTEKLLKQQMVLEQRNRDFEQ